MAPPIISLRDVRLVDGRRAMFDGVDLGLEARARFLRDDSLSADLLEERAHVLLGFADPKDYVIRVTPNHG